MRDLPTDYQTFIHRSRYARWSDAQNRRETWIETVSRYFSFFAHHLEEKHSYSLSLDEFNLAFNSVLSLSVMPSMRCLMTAGRALGRDNVAGYNCCYLPINNLRAFDELLFILMCGTGVGFSVERQFISELPAVPADLSLCDRTIVVRDSKRGWAEAFRELIRSLYSGDIPTWNTSLVRPAGSRLRTMGGRASGPKPLEELFGFAVRVFSGSRGRRLTSIELHDLACKVGDCVVMGGVRRSALISLSNLSDLRMREAKSGSWWLGHPERALANNSVAYLDRPDPGTFMDEWLSLYRSKSGERGIFNRGASLAGAVQNNRRSSPADCGTNPCGEIILRPREFCNLSEVVARPTDTFESLAAKVRVATILGTWQSTLTNFRYLSREFARNCEEERLLGVSVTGISDCPALRETSSTSADLWRSLRDVAISTNSEWAARLSIPPSAAITCVKPSGTVSQLVSSSSGIHPRHARFYLRRVRQDAKDPLSNFLISQGVPVEGDVLHSEHLVFTFPQRAPEGALTRAEMSALDLLKLRQHVQQNWCEHQVSCTVSIRESEWLQVGSFVYDNFDSISGVSFLPYSEHTYAQAPFEEVSESQLVEWEAKMPAQIDWDSLVSHESTDNTTGSQESACQGGVCEL